MLTLWYHRHWLRAAANDQECANEDAASAHSFCFSLFCGQAHRRRQRPAEKCGDVQAGVLVCFALQQTLTMSVAAAAPSPASSLDLSNPVLRVVQEAYTLCLVALPPKTQLPGFLTGDDDDDEEEGKEQPFYSLTRTREEISILATQELADEIVENLPHGLQMLDEVTRWAVFRIKGPLDLSMVGSHRSHGLSNSSKGRGKES